jgi:putative NADH-flavin reductase
MNVVLIGGSGGAGSELLRELTSRGHQVTAVVRRADAIDAGEYPGVTLAAGDAYDQESLEKAFAGADVVVSAFNPGWTDPELYDRYLAGARTIQAAARNAGVARLLVVGGAASLVGPDGRKIIETVDFPEPYAGGVRAAADYLDELRGEHDLDWVFLSPPLGYGPMGPTGRRGSYRTGTDRPVADEHGTSEISGPDLALAMVDEVEVPRHHRQRFTVGY